MASEYCAPQTLLRAQRRQGRLYYEPPAWPQHHPRYWSFMITGKSAFNRMKYARNFILPADSQWSKCKTRLKGFPHSFTNKFRQKRKQQAKKQFRIWAKNIIWKNPQPSFFLLHGWTEAFKVLHNRITSFHFDLPQQNVRFIKLDIYIIWNNQLIYDINT